jgi:hypothetical protein
MASQYEQKTEAIRRLLSPTFSDGTTLGSWFQGEKRTGMLGLVESAVKTSMEIEVGAESWAARGMYWVCALGGTAMSGFWIWALIVHASNARNGLIVAPMIFVASVLLYYLGWGWRWLWTGRTEHLFRAKRYTAPGRLDDARKNIASALALWNF